MEFIIAPGEPLHGAVARLAKNSILSRGSVVAGLIPHSDGGWISFVLPTHLRTISANLPRHLGASPEWLLENATFYPAVAPFLESQERDALCERLFSGQRPSGYPICSSRYTAETASPIKCCPICVATDRTDANDGMPSICGARWRRPHNLFGVNVCWLHGCTLIPTNALFSDVRVLHEAESVIPQVLPDPTPGDPIDFEIAKELSFLFDPICARPGRARIAAALREHAAELGFELSTRQMDMKAIADRIREVYPADWLNRHGVKFTALSKSWGKETMSTAPQVYPAFTLALLARALGVSLQRLLEDATSYDPISRPEAGNRKRNWVNREISAQERQSRREKLLALIRAHPEYTRSEIYRAANHLMTLLSHNDREWLAATLPPKKDMSDVSTFDWSQMDEAAAHQVHERAKQLRLAGGKPVRITETLLRRGVGQRGRTGPGWRARLPKLHAALREEAESDLTYAKRRLAWVELEIREGRLPPLHGSVYLQRTGLEVLVVKHREIRDLLVQTLEQRGTSPQRRSRGLACLATGLAEDAA